MPVRDPLSGRWLPSPATINRRGVQELVQTLQRFGVPVDYAHLQAMTLRAIEQVVAANNPTEAMLEKAEAQLESNMQRALASQARAYVREAELSANSLNKGSDLAIWICQFSKHSCGDCKGRHSEVHTMDDWEILGTPGTPNVECDGYCLCELLPASIFDGEPLPDGERGDVVVTFEMIVEPERAGDTNG